MEDEAPASKRVLVVDDSITVRELERQLLEARGYRVDVAVDGVDGWNTIRSAQYDLVVSDVDMPRMDGIQLVETSRRIPGFRKSPSLSSRTKTATKIGFVVLMPAPISF